VITALTVAKIAWTRGEGEPGTAAARWNINTVSATPLAAKAASASTVAEATIGSSPRGSLAPRPWRREERKRPRCCPGAAAGQVFGEATRDHPRRPEPFDDPPLCFSIQHAALPLVPGSFAEVVLNLGEDASLEAASSGELSPQLAEVDFYRPGPTHVEPLCTPSTARENSRQSCS
jgi:hypothetical protein